MAAEFRRPYLVRLPLPLAQLYSRAYNAKDARGRHDNTFYLFEALVKLAASTGVMSYLADVQESGTRVAALDRLLLQLALPSLGQWLSMLRELSRHYGKRIDAASLPLGHWQEQLEQPRRDLPAVLALYGRIKNGPDGAPSGVKSCSLLELFDSLVQYRNAVFGHGGGRWPQFYENEMGPLLFPAANEVLAEGVFEPLGRAGSRLVYLTELRTLDEGHMELGLRELVGLQSERVPPISLDARAAAGLATNRVAVLWPGHSVPLRIDPLLVYRESELSDEVLFLNRQRSQKHIEYLSYTTGRTERDRGTAQALAALLTRVAGQEVSTERLEELSEQSLAETTSVEALVETPSAARRMGDYEILAEVGRGGMGVVYLARQMSLGRLVALKMLPADLAGDEVALARFRREVRHLARCEHPHIVKVLSSGTFADGQLYYTMEYVPGCDLEQVWRELSGTRADADASGLGNTTFAQAVLSASRKRRAQTESRASQPSAADSSPLPEVETLPLPPLPDLPSISEAPGDYVRRVVMMVRDAALALQTVHDQAIVHRDVKPANLMLSPDGSRVVLMDFGLAKGQSHSLSISRAGGLLGTMRYAAPEQLAAASLKVGPQADVRGLGVTLWELLTRRRLFGEAEDESQLAARIYGQDVPRLRTIDPSFDADLEAIVDRATARSLDDRLESAAKLAELLDLYLDGQPLPIRPPSAAELARRWIRGHRVLVYSASTIAAVLLVAGVVSLVLLTRALRSETRARIATEDRARSERELAESRRRQAQQAEAETQARGQAALQQRLAYIGQINQAERAWRDGDSARAVAFLDGTPEDERNWEWYHLKKRYQGSRLTLGSTGRPLLAMAISPVGSQCAAGGEAGTVDVYDWITGQAICQLKHGDLVRAVAFTRDGQRLITGGADRFVRIWRLPDGVLERTLPKHRRSVTAVAVSPTAERIATASDDGKAQIWNLEDGTPVGEPCEHNQSVQALCFSPDGATLATCGRDQTIHLWDAETGKSLHDYVDNKRPEVSHDALVYSPDGTHLATAGAGGIVKLFDPTDGTYQAMWDAHPSRVFSIGFDKKGEQLATAGLDRTIRIWLVDKNQAPTILSGHAGAVRCVAFTPEGDGLISASDDGTLRVWSTSDPPESQSLRSHDDEVYSVSISPDGSRLASTSYDRTLRVWEYPEGRLLNTLSGHEKKIHAGVFSPDGKRVATASEDGTVRLWSAADGTLLHTLSGHTAGVNAVAFHPTGKQIASASEDGSVRIWDATNGKMLRELAGHQDRVTTLAYDSAGTRLATGCGDRKVRLWKADEGTLEQEFVAHDDAVWCVAFSQDGRRLLSGGWDNVAKLWSVPDGKLQMTLSGHRGTLTAVMFTPDGNRMITAGGDRTVRVWDPTTAQQVISFDLKTICRALAFDQREQNLVLGCDDDLVRVWLGGSAATAASSSPITAPDTSQPVAIENGGP